MGHALTAYLTLTVLGLTPPATPSCDLEAVPIWCAIEVVPVWVAAMEWSFHTGIPAWYFPLQQASSL